MARRVRLLDSESLHTEKLFVEDAYVKDCEATVLSVNDRGGILLDRTVFYPTGGGQPGDSGYLDLGNGTRAEIVTAVKDGDTVVHVAAEGQTLPQPGSLVSATIDWDRRYRHMKMHSALHLLSGIVPLHINGAQVGSEKSRIDFGAKSPTEGGADGETPPASYIFDKEALGGKLNRIAAAAHPVTPEWITEEDLVARPELIRTLSIRPPSGTGTVRLLRIGEIDIQPCGGTHVANTGEIDPLRISKIESKGKQNKRVSIVFDA